MINVETELKLHYLSPTREWMEGLPLGNGRLAAMVRCAEKEDILSLNHEWLWRACNKNRENEVVADQLAQLRGILQKGDYFTATSLANCWLGGRGGISQLPGRVDAYQPAADLVFQLTGPVTFQDQALDLRQGVASCRRQLGAWPVTAHYLASLAHKRIICHWQSEGKFSGRLTIDRAAYPDLTARCDYQADQIVFTGLFTEGMAYQVVVELVTDGRAWPGQDCLLLEDASQLMLLINLATSVRGIDDELLAWPAPNNLDAWPDILARQQKDFSSYMDRFKVCLDLPDNPLPTDQRVADLRQGGQDENLLILFAQYGRYLLLSSSLAAQLPANLQGKWNDMINPPWDCDYHLNINLQMNYWAAHSTGLAECAQPLFAYLHRLHQHGKRAARDLYGCSGTYLPLQTDAWARATPESFGWAVWIGAAAWLASHFWQHYQYSGEQEFLVDSYPFLRDTADFYLDYCCRDEEGIWQIMPSQSPENRFAGTGFWPVSLGISSAMDVQLAHNALDYAIKAARILQKDPEKSQLWQEMRENLPPFAIGSDGRLLEWNEEFEEVEPGHRHMSHLYGLYPAELFNPQQRPDHYRAALKSLDQRLAQGGGHTGWSRAWTSCLMARGGRGGQARKHLLGLITDFATKSLLGLHPPRIFQIDGNLGATAALVEALAQFWQGKLHLLRALPDQWPAGRINGLRVPGGHTVDFSWRNRKIKTLTVEIGYAKSLHLCHNQARELIISGQAGEKISLTEPFDG